MVDQLQDPKNPFKGYIGDIVLPDLPPNAEALATRAAQRLYLRRFLLILSTGVISVFVLFDGLSVIAGSLGLALIVVGAAFLPREGVIQLAKPIFSRSIL